MDPELGLRGLFVVFEGGERANARKARKLRAMGQVIYFVFLLDIRDVWLGVCMHFCCPEVDIKRRRAEREGGGFYSWQARFSRSIWFGDTAFNLVKHGRTGLSV